jgi:large subunit ribosomal protein L4
VPKLDVLNMNGERVGDIELSDAIFNAEINESVLHEVVKNYLANQRQGTHKAKTRAEVRGGGRKPFKQKGTGRARQGTTRAPQYKGGGVVFAKAPRDFSYKLPKQVKRVAMKSALSSKLKNNELILVDALNLNAPKTQEMVKVLSNIKANQKSYIVSAQMNDNVYRSARNIAGVQATFVGEMNVYEILKHNSLILTQEAVNLIQEVYK